MCGKRSVGVVDLREEAADVQRLEKSIFCQAAGEVGVERIKLNFQTT